ncbi:DUF4252 domain-containing protein [Bacteroides sp. UBA939]|uniref:DUF4252 domain-containing protein n=1 Tax=Bacteroides sp. UBA939 TaxID=1946092 RepID=UPI0025C426E4|nr:DUF4252 domain-containing protein [Bacteroides sp. UBA939]
MKTKYFLLTLICLACSAMGYAQNDNKLFEKYVDVDGVTSVYISKAMFNMMPAIEDIGLNLMNMKGKVESLYTITTSRKDLIPQMRNEFSQLVGKTHEELMRVRDGKSKVTFYANMNGENVKDLLMIVDDENNFIIMQLVGRFTLQDIQEITKDID